MIAKAEQEEAERQRKAADEAAARIEHDRIASAGKVIEPAAQPAASATAAEIGGYTHAPPVAAGLNSMTGSARLLDRLDDLARQMTERELSDLVIRAAHILENRRAAA